MEGAWWELGGSELHPGLAGVGAAWEGRCQLSLGMPRRDWRGSAPQPKSSSSEQGGRQREGPGRGTPDSLSQER